MRGIIAEINGSSMIVIAKNGDFVKCRKLPNCNIGDEVNIPAKNMNTVYKRISAVAASFIILAMLSTGVYAYYTPYSYVSVDINPSLELYVNRFDKVIGTHAFNEDGEKLLNASNGLKNKAIDAAMEQILDKAKEQGYLKQDAENSVMIVVSSNSTKEEADLSSKVSQASTAVLSKVSSNYEVILEKTKVEQYQKAKKGNVSPGKMILAEQFKEVKPEINEEEIKHMPLQQVIKQIEKKDDKDIKDNKEDKSVKNDKPKAQVVAEKPKYKGAPKANIVNVKELIKEKNEELGKKLDQHNDKDKEKDNKNKDKDKKKESNTLVPDNQDNGTTIDNDSNNSDNGEKQENDKKGDKKNK